MWIKVREAFQVAGLGEKAKVSTRSSHLRARDADAAALHGAALRLAWPWWVHPIPIVTGLTGLMTLFAVFLPRESYDVWETPRYLDFENSAWLSILLLCFVIGILAITVRSLKARSITLEFSSEQIIFLKQTYKYLLLLTLLGYAFWVTSAALQGVRFTDLTNVLSLQAGAIGGLKENSRPIGGVTTITQFGPVVVVLGMVLSKLRVGGRFYLWVPALACVRAVFYAERLALIEVVVPMAVVGAVLALGSGKPRSAQFVKYAPLAAVPLVWLLFAALEYTRSWIYYSKIVAQPFAEWVSLRLIGYYVTSFNNSALMATYLPPGEVPYWTLQALWNAPGVEGVLSTPAISGQSADRWWFYLLSTAANPNFTNVGSFLVIKAELGWPIAVLYWLGAGIVVGLIYVAMTRGSVVALITYVSLFVALLELPRFMYWSEGRSVPIVIACLILAIAYPKARPRIRRRGPIGLRPVRH